MNLLNELQDHIQKNRKQRVRFQLIYDTTRQTLSADNFHQHCDNKGPTLTILYGIHNVEYGGYTTESWSTVKGVRTDANAFIFTTKGGHLEVFKIRAGYQNQAIYCFKGYGPCFGRSPLIGGGFLTFADGPITISESGIYSLNGHIKSITAFWRKHESINYESFNEGSMDVKRLEIYEVVCDELRDPWLHIKQSSDLLRKSLHGQSRTGLEGMPFNILLVGEISSGKSSFINTALSAMANEMHHPAIVSDSQYSETNKFSRYDLTPQSSANTKQISVFDVRGIEEERGMKYELEPILQGQLGLEYEFPDLDIPCSELCLNQKSPGRINVICFIIDSTTYKLMSKGLWEKLEEMKRIASKLGKKQIGAQVERMSVLETIITNCRIGFSFDRESDLYEVRRVVVITKLDKAYNHIDDDHNEIVRSIRARDDVLEIAKDIGLSSQEVYPVINYTSEETTDEISNQLVLHAVSSIVKLVEDKELAQLGEERKEPWLPIKQSSDALRNSLKGPSRPGLEGIPFNILLVGQISSGKSSFINTALSAMSDKMLQPAIVSNSPYSETNKFSTYNLTPEPSAKMKKVSLFDVRGIEESRGMTSELELLLKGDICPGYEFPDSDVSCEPQNLNVESYGRMHIICFVIDSTTHNVMSREVLAKIAEMRRIASKLEVRSVIVVTKLDETYQKIKDYHEAIFKNQSAREDVLRIASTFGISSKHVFPVINYSSQYTTDEVSNQLVLHALNSMVELAEDKELENLGSLLFNLF